MQLAFADFWAENDAAIEAITVVAIGIKVSSIVGKDAALHQHILGGKLCRQCC
jgi:hypothetical protein